MSPWATPEPHAVLAALSSAMLEEAQRQGVVAYIILAMLPDGQIGAVSAGCNTQAMADLIEESPEALREYVAAIKAGLAGPGSRS